MNWWKRFDKMAQTADYKILYEQQRIENEVSFDFII
jgi:hypothetical protein